MPTRHGHYCTLFMPLISQHSQKRLEGYSRLEWKLAVDRSHRMAAERSFINDRPAQGAEGG